MFRTRDFVLFFTTIVFLVVAIGFTFLSEHGTQARLNAFVPETTNEIDTVEATVSAGENSELSRAERLERLRQKIQESELITISEVIVVEEVLEELEEENSQENAGVLPVCDNYQVINPFWPVSKIKSLEAEGVRQYFTESAGNLSTTSSSTIVSRDILLTLPMQFIPNGSTACIPTDVVGIALDGSLIRNNETGLYSVFSNDTLIGYALDGFPLYGVGSNRVDACGGRIQLGQYRYELSSDREVVLNCFAGQPQSFQ